MTAFSFPCKQTGIAFVSTEWEHVWLRSYLKEFPRQQLLPHIIWEAVLPCVKWPFSEEIDKLINIKRLPHIWELNQKFVNSVMNLRVTLFHGQVVGTCTYSGGSGFISGYEMSCACQVIGANASMIQPQNTPRPLPSVSIRLIRQWSYHSSQHGLSYSKRRSIKILGWVKCGEFLV